jgi:LCP family protein required for cell wall assembly
MRHIPVRRWPRRVLVAFNILAALALITVGSAYGYARWRLDSIRTIAAPHLSVVAPTAHKSDGLTAENILLIGNETRAGLTNPTEIQQFGSPQIYSGSLSDVIMILHLDPARNTASILSIPRDLFVPMPPGSPVGPYQKIDAALNDGAKGPDNLIQTITDDFGIAINHYIELNFDGFQQTVNAIGGINVDFPEPLFDGTSLLNIPTTGCQHLNGTQALITHYRHLNPNAVPETTLPVTQVGGASGYYYAGAAIGDVDFPVQPADSRVIAAWDQSSVPAPVAPASVTVRNITNTYRLAAQAGSALAADGLHVVTTTSATIPAATTETLIHYHPGQVADALAVMSHLSGAVMLQSDATIPAGSVTVDAGSLLTVAASPAAAATAPATTTPATTVAAPTTTPTTRTAPSTTVPRSATAGPTPGGQTPSSSSDQLQPWDPRPCP